MFVLLELVGNMILLGITPPLILLFGFISLIVSLIILLDYLETYFGGLKEYLKAIGYFFLSFTLVFFTIIGWYKAFEWLVNLL